MGGFGKFNIIMFEDFFVVGYVVCFGLVCDFVVKSMFKLNLSNIEIYCDVGIGMCDEGGFGLKVGLIVWISGLV